MWFKFNRRNIEINLFVYINRFPCKVFLMLFCFVRLCWLRKCIRGYQEVRYFKLKIEIEKLLD